MEDGSSKGKRVQFDNILIWVLILLVIAAVTLMILEWPKLLPLSVSLRSRLEADYGSSSLMDTIGVLRLQIIEDVFRDLGLPIDLSVVETEVPVPTATDFVPLDTETPTLEFTATPTWTRTPTDTPTPSATPSITPTKTRTPIAPTATKTRKPPTPRPPTHTFTPSVTPTPSDTPTPTDTLTPTATLTPTITPTPTPADSARPSFSTVVFVFTKVGTDQCRISVTQASVYDLAISYGIGPNGIGSRNGYVRLSCNTGGGDLCNTNLSGNDSSYTPYGGWNAAYTGSATIGPIDDTTIITYRAHIMDNAGKTSVGTNPLSNIGCLD